MRKFVFKFLVLFILIISCAFFSLVAFQKYSMDRQMADVENFAPRMAPYDMPPPPPPAPNAPPLLPPVTVIILISAGFVGLILRHIGKNYVVPLNIIKEKVNLIKDGNLNVEFKAQSESEDIISTFKTLNEMTEGLLQKEKLQDDFIRNLVHDLRNPVLAQEKAIAILQDEFQGHELLDGLMKNSEMYLDMINLIIEAHSMRDVKIDKIKFNLYTLAESLKDALKPAADDKEIKITNKISKDLYVFADYISTTRILTNLITNAVESIPRGKEITLFAKNNGQNTVITVEDNSGSISDETAKHIFDEKKLRQKGKKTVSGLGLQIVYQLVIKNGGKINLDAVPNEYTKFIIELPNEGNNEKN